MCRRMRTTLNGQEFEISAELAAEAAEATRPFRRLLKQTKAGQRPDHCPVSAEEIERLFRAMAHIAAELERAPDAPAEASASSKDHR